MTKLKSARRAVRYRKREGGAFWAAQLEANCERLGAKFDDEAIQYVREHKQPFLHLSVFLSIAITCRIEFPHHQARPGLQFAPLGRVRNLGGAIYVESKSCAGGNAAGRLHLAATTIFRCRSAFTS